MPVISQKVQMPDKPVTVESTFGSSTFSFSKNKKKPMGKQNFKATPPTRLIKSPDSFSSDFSSQTDDSSLPVKKNDRLTNIKSATAKDKSLTTFKMGPPK
jgi:hypothetical protein